MAAADRLLATLNAEQRAAVVHADGPLQVIAGPGTGKRRVLVARVAWLIASGRARPEEICALAFMNDAAGQIGERLRRVVGPDAARAVWAGTSHRLAARLLRGHAARFGRGPSFSIWDEHDVDAALRGLVAESGLRISRARVRAHARASAERLHPPHVQSRDGNTDTAVTGALAAYETAKRASSALDFDDLLRYAVIALESDPELRARCARRFTHVLVDEFQDLNPAQYRLAALLAEGHRRLTVLGDPRQAICAYRGATSEANFAAFARDFPDATTVVLRRSYRCSAPILAAANRLAAPLGQDLGADPQSAAAGAPVAVVACEDGDDELRRIAAWARAHDRDGERAVLVRLNAQLGPIEQALLGAGVPVSALGARPFGARAEIRAALAALALAANPRDRLAFARTAAAAGRGVGPAACRALFAHADREPARSLLEHGAEGAIPGLGARQRAALRELCAPLLEAARPGAGPSGGVAAHVTRVLVASGQPQRQRRSATGGARAPTRARAQRRLRHLRALMAQARAYERRTARPRLADFLAEVALAGDERALRPGALTLSTAHRAKGLEFDHVWLAGAEEGRLPHARSVRDGEEREERRLAYVAVTRARRTLTVSWAAERDGRPREPSRYLDDIQAARDHRPDNRPCED